MKQGGFSLATGLLTGFIAIVLLFGGWFFYSIYWGKYNKIIAEDEKVNEAWGNVEAQYQRRSDLIPNLINVVKGYANHEKEVLLGITEARAQAGQTKISIDNLTPENMAKFQEVQGNLSSALTRLLAVSERYPQLQADQNFLALQAQLEGTENRIAVARTRYNESIKNYNTIIRQFPGNITANMNGFERRAEFKSEAGAEVAPKVEF